MTGFNSKRKIAQDRLDDDDIQVYAKAISKRPVEADYNSHSAYTRALEAFFDTLAQPPLPVQPDHFLSVNSMAQLAQKPVDNDFFKHIAKKSPSPDKREWVGLTDEEIDKWTPEIHGVIRSIEQALKEKNT